MPAIQTSFVRRAADVACPKEIFLEKRLAEVAESLCLEYKAEMFRKAIAFQSDALKKACWKNWESLARVRLEALKSQFNIVNSPKVVLDLRFLFLHAPPGRVEKEVLRYYRNQSAVHSESVSEGDIRRLYRQKIGFKRKVVEAEVPSCW